MQKILNLPPHKDFIVQQTRVMALNLPVLISTVRLMFNHGTYEVPIWYESMVFKSDEHGGVVDWMDLEMRRYMDEDAAVNGHADLVMRWLEKWVPTEHELPSGDLPQLTSGEPT